MNYQGKASVEVSFRKKWGSSMGKRSGEGM
jgi:hypothetical protein